MHEGEVLVFILSVDIQYARFDLDDISGKAAEAMGADGWPPVWRYYPVTDQFQSFGLPQVRGKKEPPGPQRRQIGGAAHRKKLERITDPAYNTNSDNKAG